jgi:acyl-CoA thioester hydrolase
MISATATLRVIYGDTDQMGVVYYANYLRYFEASRVEWLRAAGIDYRRCEEEGLFLPVIEAHARYRAPARFDDLIQVEATPSPARAVSVRFDYRGRRDDTLLAEGHTLHACIGRDGKPRRFPDFLREKLQ